MKKDNEITGYPVTMVQAPPAAELDDDGIDIRALLTILWRGKWVIVICTLIASVLGFLAGAQQTPVYRASAKVMFDTQRANVLNGDEVLVDWRYDALEDQMEVLRSTSLIERVIAELRLDQNPAFNPALRIPEPTFRDRIGGFVALPPELTDLASDLGMRAPPPPAPDPVEAARRERLSVINSVRWGLRLESVGGSRVIEIGYTSTNPRTAAAVVNSISQQYIVDQLEAKLEATREATSWLSGRVEELRDRVQTAEVAVEEKRAELSAEIGQTLEVTRQQLESLNGELARVRAARSRLEPLFARLSEAVEGGLDLGTISEFRDSTLIQRYREQEDELVAQKRALSERVKDRHPAMQRLNLQLEDVRQNISEEAARIVAAAQVDAQAIQSEETALMAEVRRLEEKAQQQSRDEIQLRQLEREAEASRVLYENFLARLEETNEQDDLQTADARILSPAEIPLFPESQTKRRILMIATLAGAIVGVGIVFLLDRLNNTFRSPSQLEDLAGERVLGVLPSLGSRMKRADIIRHLRDKPASSLAESVRNLRTSILFSNIDKPPKVLMFTSSVPGEGKSTSSTLLALTSRQMGKSAIIVDCDLRLPALARLLNTTDREVGLISVLEGTAELEEAVYKDPESGLHVLMTQAGERRGAVSAADILSSRKFEDLIKRLSGLYDLVILDTPPALVVTDARIVSKLADAVIYAVRWDSTPRGAVIEGLKELHSIKAPVAGCVMTLVNEDKASRYSYDGYSYYKGRYRDYYGA